MVIPQSIPVHQDRLFDALQTMSRSIESAGKDASRGKRMFFVFAVMLSLLLSGCGGGGYAGGGISEPLGDFICSRCRAIHACHRQFERQL